MAKIDPTKQHKTFKRLEKLETQKRNYSNFIDAYLTFTQNQESTKKIHRWVAISIMAGAMQRKVLLDFSHYKVFPNLYTFIIGESGTVRKSTSTGIGVDLLRELDTVKIMSERVTAASLIEQLGRCSQEFEVDGRTEYQSAPFCYASELIVLMREVFGSTSELLTTFYDCAPNNSHKPWVYETKGSGRTEIFGPCLNLLGASTPAWLTKAIPANEMEGGFASRVIFVVEQSDPDKFIAIPERDPVTAQMRPKLVEDLQTIHSLRGTFEFTPEAKDFYKPWYENYRRDKTKIKDPRFAGYYARKPITCLKIAMVLAVNEGNELKLQTHHIQEGIDLLTSLENDMIDAFGATGNNRLAPGIEKVKTLLKLKGTMEHGDLMQYLWRDYTGDEVSIILSDLGRMHNVKSQAQNGTYVYTIQN